jgi:hypothetical protein
VLNIEVVADPMQEESLSFENIKSIPAVFDALLIDIDYNASYNLRRIQELKTNSDAGLRRFDVVIGTKDFMERRANSIGIVPQTLLLEQNYPNPFNPATVIRYQLPVTGRVVLKVFDILGREVVRLLEY